MILHQPESKANQQIMIPTTQFALRDLPSPTELLCLKPVKLAALTVNFSLTRNLMLRRDDAFAPSLGSEQQADLFLLGQHIISTNLQSQTK